jgi:hypothetical protein
MRVLTEDAIVVCTHQLGRVERRPSQDLVRVDGRKVLVDDDPVGRSIRMCPNYGVTVKPCNNTLAVTVGYSTLVRVDGQRVCLDTVRGLTDGTPPSVVEYEIRDPGQVLVSSAA